MPHRAEVGAARALHRAGLAALILGMITLQGCSTWREGPLDRARLDQPTPPRKTLVRTIDGREFLLQSPTLSGDSLIGLEWKDRTMLSDTVPSPKRIALHRDQVREVAVRQVEPVRTIFGILVVGVVIGTAIFPANFFRTYD
jgi:hypothetical protein